MNSLTISQILLSLSTLTILFMLYYVLKKKPLVQLQKIFATALVCVLIVSTGVLIQSICKTYFNINPVPFESYIYIGTCFLPVSIFFTALAFNNTKLKFKLKYILVFIIPVISIIMVWTNKYYWNFRNT